MTPFKMRSSKRVAVCLSGHLRTVGVGSSLFEQHVMQPNPDWEFDFFIDTWSSRDWRQNDGVDLTRRSAGISDAMHTFWPIAMRVQKHRAWDTSRFYKYIKEGDVKKSSRGEHIMGMYYKIFKCDELLRAHENELGFVYDLVMRHRTDIALKGPLRFSDEIVQRSLSTIFVAKNHSDQVEWCSDVSAFSSSAGMLHYSRVFPSIQTIADQHHVFRPEPMLYHHLRSSSFSIEEFEPDWSVLKESD